MAEPDLFIDRGATFSACRRYRYLLWRRWDRSIAPANFLLLNPSTADEIKNDPTVERCERRARAMGYGGLIVTNAFALRSTDPKALYAEADPVGPDNAAAIVEAARAAALVVCGWGRHCEAVRPGWGRTLLRMLAEAGAVPHALAITSDGSPKHPLYVGYATQPAPVPAI
jgi:hypothetical protein